MDFVDYDALCDEKIPEFQNLAKEGKFDEAIDKLMALEKDTRMAGDAKNNARVLIAILNLCYERHDFTALNDNVLILSKRRNLIKLSISKMVGRCFEYLEEIPDKNEKYRLVETLRTVCSGKMYLEVEAVKIARLQAAMKEHDGDIKGAAAIMQDEKVEPLGSLGQKEKVDFLLEQIRLTLAVKDFIRAQIISKKIQPRFFDSGDVDDLKSRYYRLMLQVDRHDKNYDELTKHYHILYKMPSTQGDPEAASKLLQSTVLCSVLTPSSPEQIDFMRILKKEKLLEELPTYGAILDNFLTEEVIRWTNFLGHYRSELEQPVIDVFDSWKDWFDDLKLRVIERNIYMIAKYYTAITIRRMAQILEVNLEETRQHVSDMVNKNLVHAKIDSLAEVIRFEHTSRPTEILNNWSTNVNELMKHLNVAAHLIHKEVSVNEANRRARGDM